MKRFVGILILLVAIGALFGWKYLQQKRLLPGGGETIGNISGISEIEVKGVIGGEKAGFLADPEVQKLLAEKYKLRVTATKSGSLAMMRTELTGLDFLWPASRSAAETFRGKAKRVEDIFNSPIVIYSWEPVAQALSQPVQISSGPAADNRPLVEKSGNSYYIVELARLIKAVENKVEWAKLGLPQLNGRINVISTNPSESNSGYAYAGLLANTLNGDIPDISQIDPLIPRVRLIFTRMGRVETSSGTLFKNYLTQGLGAFPMIIGYENQLAEFAAENPAVLNQVSKLCRILYPKPTTWSSHPLVVLSEGGKRLVDALLDPAVQRLAWEQHGFRVGLMSSQSTLSPVLKEIGVAPSIESVQQMPSNEVLEKILEGLVAR
ncbi:MAG TPA: hypothetical protein VMW38_05160 [Terriglobia bacterium]|nr:hypothetical protein [Terriglobia bacterium]